MIAPVEALKNFERVFGRPPKWAARAPGRVNLIGEHTDYNGGLVLPCAIDLSTLSVAAPRDDRRICVRAWDLDETIEFSTDSFSRGGGWPDYVMGVCSALAEAGLHVPGADLLVTSTLPIGSGLSSSAALSVSLMAVMDCVMGLGETARSWAKLAHRAESHFVGVGCGVLDPFASALGLPGHALRIDCRDERVEPIEIRGEAWQILLFHSGVTRRLAESFYSDRVTECERALEGVRRAGIGRPDVQTLCDLDSAVLPDLARVLEPEIFLRARHVISENERVDQFCRALRAGEHGELGNLLRSGQASLRNDYRVSIPELDVLCELANRCPGVLGSRLTGAGGGGCTLHLVQPAQVNAVREAVSTGFEERFGRRPDNWAVSTAQGVQTQRFGD